MNLIRLLSNSVCVLRYSCSDIRYRKYSRPLPFLQSVDKLRHDYELAKKQHAEVWYGCMDVRCRYSNKGRYVGLGALTANHDWYNHNHYFRFGL